MGVKRVHEMLTISSATPGWRKSTLRRRNRKSMKSQIKVLYIQPVGCEGPDLIDEALPASVEREMCRPAIGQPLPERPDTYSAIVVLGGPMGVYETEKYPWIKDLIDLLSHALETEVPILGICFGSQALAAAAGAEVRPTGRQEIGWGKIEHSGKSSKDDLLSGFPSPIEVFHWHGDRWDLPDGAVLLASSEACDHQIFRIGQNTYGFQCHLEVRPETPPIWVEAYHDQLLALPAGPSPEEILDQTARFAPILRPHALRLFARFWSCVLGDGASAESFSGK